MKNLSKEEGINDADISAKGIIQVLQDEDLRRIFIHHNQELVEQLKILLTPCKEEVKTAEGASTKSNYFLRLEQLEYPHREICGLCHRAVAVGFWVPDEIWSAVVHHRYATTIHCLNCFIERADEKLIDWSKEIKFYAVSLRSHLAQFKSQSEAVGEEKKD